MPARELKVKKHELKHIQHSDIQLITTEDGSHTLFVPSMNEHYHSVHGAVQESMHVFIQAGFHEIVKLKDEIHILEIGFGTGLNALLTFCENLHLNKRIIYTAVEAYPLEKEIYEKLNYADYITDNAENNVLQLMHQQEWNKTINISDVFELQKINCKTEELELKNDFFDLIYFDAFAPQFQPELWSKEVFEKIFFSMRNHSILMTYCAKGEVKRNLRSAGFVVEGIPGPKGKREITRARKNSI